MLSIGIVYMDWFCFEMKHLFFAVDHCDFL